MKVRKVKTFHHFNRKEPGHQKLPLKRGHVRSARNGNLEVPVYFLKAKGYTARKKWKK
jgi:hypothetical protein